MKFETALNMACATKHDADDAWKLNAAEAINGSP